MKCTRKNKLFLVWVECMYFKAEKERSLKIEAKTLNMLRGSKKLA